MKRNWLILFILALVIFLPPGMAGYWQWSHAQNAGQYEAAARLLPWQAGLYEKAGNAALASQDFTGAIRLFLLEKQRGTLSAEGRFNLSQAYWAAGEQNKAISLWESLLNERQETVSAAQVLTRQYHAEERFQDEERVIRQWLNSDPTNAEANERLGILLSASALPEALTRLENAVAASPQAASRLEGLLKALRQADTPATYRLTLAGQALAALGEWPLARAAFERATQADETYAPAWAWLGLARQQTHTAEAQPALEHALAIDPACAPIRSMAGLYWQRQGDPARAQQEYRAAIRLEPQNPAWRLALAGLQAQSDLPAALQNYLQATQLAPNDPQTWYALAAFCVENNVYLEEYGLDAALRAYARQPENFQYADLLGRALAAYGETASAESMYQKAAALAPQDPAPLFHLALLYLQTGRSAQAKDALQTVIRLAPNGLYSAQAHRVLQRYFP